MDYSIELYYDAERVEAALRATAGMADRKFPREVLVRLPEDRELILPFTSQFQSDAVRLKPHGTLQLETSLLFATDDAIREYLSWDPEDRQLFRDGERAAAIGYIYLFVALGDRYAALSFTAATSDMSRLFLASPSIRSRFLKLQQETGALAAIFDIEDEWFPLLSDPGRRIHLPEEDYLSDEGCWGANVDRFTELLLERIARVD